MSRAGAVTFGDLEGKRDVLDVACRKCARNGQCRVAKLIERHGRDAKLVELRPRRAPERPTPASANPQTPKA